MQIDNYKLIYVDGGCSGNSILDYSKRKMIWVVTDHMGDVIFEQEDMGGSNNIAEILGVRDGIKQAIKEGCEGVMVKTDSQVARLWIESAMYSPSPRIGKKINDPERTLGLLFEIKELSKQIDLYIQWIPRDKNLAGHYIESKYQL